MSADREQIAIVLARAEEGLRNGTITQEQHDALLKSYFGTPDVAPMLKELSAPVDHDSRVNKTTLLIAGFSLFMLSLFVTMFYSTGGLTGAVTLEHPMNITYFADARISLDLHEATRINITGSAQGDGTIIITLVANGQTHVLHTFNKGVVTAHANLSKAYYLTGEPVKFQASSLSSAYLMGDEATLLDNNTLVGLIPGQYTIKLIINDTELSQETLTFTVIDLPASETFNVCGELCNANITANATVEISIAGNATVAVGGITVFSEQNRPPQLLQEIPDITGTGTVRIDVQAAFHDADGDQLFFDSSHHDGMSESVEDGVLTVSGEPGTYSYTVYASDLQELSPSNLFTITLLPESSAPLDANESEQNVTAELNGTAPAVNETVQNDAAISNSTSSANTTEVNDSTSAENSSVVADCSDPNPNLRPIECLMQDPSRYFPDQDIYWENLDRTQVAKFTEIGNLLIKGDVIEYATGGPGLRDFRIGTTDQDGNSITTIWIDEDGNLHLRGSLVEENTNLEPTSGSYSVISKRSIYLAYADTQTGTLYLRGNIIPLRRTI